MVCEDLCFYLRKLSLIDGVEVNRITLAKNLLWCLSFLNLLSF